MNAYNNTSEGSGLTKEQRRTNFQPVFDDEGHIIGISILKNEYDEELATAAIHQWHNNVREDLGENNFGADVLTGMSALQKRLLVTPPPLEIHHIRADEKWDPVKNVKVATPSVVLPVPHMTQMFELIFPFQYSVRQEVGEVKSEIVSNAFDNSGQPRSAGTAYYATAKYTIELDLAHGKSRVFEGFGTNYTSIGGNGERGAGLVASTSTFVQRAALTEAMRNCYDKMGVCFRRGFKDASEQMKHLEHILLLELKGLAHEARPKAGENVQAFHARIAKRAQEAAARAPLPKKVVTAPAPRKAETSTLVKVAAAPAPKARIKSADSEMSPKEKVAQRVAAISERANSKPSAMDQFLSEFKLESSSFWSDGELGNFLLANDDIISKLNDEQSERFIEIEAAISKRLHDLAI